MLFCISSGNNVLPKAFGFLRSNFVVVASPVFKDWKLFSIPNLKPVLIDLIMVITSEKATPSGPLIPGTLLIPAAIAYSAILRALNVVLPTILTACVIGDDSKEFTQISAQASLNFLPKLSLAILPAWYGFKLKNASVNCSKPSLLKSAPSSPSNNFIISSEPSLVGLSSDCTTLIPWALTDKSPAAFA